MINPLDLHALADGELEKGEAAQLRQALKNDSEAKAEFEAILNFKDVLKEKPLTYQSEETWRACVKRFNQIDRTKKVESFVGRYAWAMCGVVFALIVGGRYMVKDVRGESARTADLERLLPGRGAQTAEDPAIEQQFKEILSRAATVTDPNPVKGLQVTTGQFQGIPAGRFRLRDAEGTMVLFVIHGDVNFEDVEPDPTHPDMQTGLLTSPAAPYGMNCAIWHSNGFTMALGGDRSSEELEAVAGRINPQIR
jgi:hypothetical protein